ncbi:HNH endonuclease [Pusillimonas sp.]|uniref:HNH endonuclease n=1 Tax=Pusillimonas sp. TaxID=3040095 RepID=UPI0029AF7768|nr:HNH endonuclease [Pusillimonas sp.]MDX3894868.1 HNH endonuclease [Pusillimonas sp.]
MNQQPIFEAQHVFKAADIWKSRPGYGGFRQSLKYDVCINGEYFPPKAIAAIAQEEAGQSLMTPADFAGVKEGKWHKAFRKLGFPIVEKNNGAAKSTTSFSAPGFLQQPDDILDLILEKEDTVRRREIEARLGQGQYRRRMLRLWEDRCAVTQCTLNELIRASHAKPWRECEDKPAQRIDPNNGLPLVANLDALFDAGWISFDSDGMMLVTCDKEVESVLRGIPRHLFRKPTAKQDTYLDWHRKRCYRGEYPSA